LRIRKEARVIPALLRKSGALAVSRLPAGGDAFKPPERTIS
jgi:hypothetical protein